MVKPVLEFAQDYDEMHIYLLYEIYEVLKDAGYFELKIDWELDLSYVTEYTDLYYVKCIIWLQKNYPKDYYQYQKSIFFTNKDIAMLMKLSVI
jgi:hypothetical protein